MATGNTYVQQTDVRVPGLGGGLNLVRTYDSVWPITSLGFPTGMFGLHWRCTYEERIARDSDNHLKYLRSDGSLWAFGLNDGAWVISSPGNVSAGLSVVDLNLFLEYQNGEQRQFDLVTGVLTAIIDRNGNTTQLAYDSSNRLITVTDPASRHLTFTYASSTSLLVTGVTSDVGLSLGYAYDAQGRLTQVTNPDLTTITFTYNSQSLISSVTDSAVKVLETHTYDSNGRGLTSSRANGVGAVTMTYY